MPALCERKTDISIIVPVYNLEEFLTPMINSLTWQDFGGYTVQIIFVLNNCTDRSEDVIRDSELDCTVIECTTQGCGPARNAGFEIATGEYVWFLDGDDWLLSSTAVKEVLDKAYAEDLDILYIPFSSKTYRSQYFSMMPQYLLRREWVKEFRFPDYQPAEDDAYMMQVLAKAGKNQVDYWTLPSVGKPLYYYNFGRPGSNMMRYYAGEQI